MKFENNSDRSNVVFAKLRQGISTYSAERAPRISECRKISRYCHFPINYLPRKIKILIFSKQAVSFTRPTEKRAPKPCTYPREPTENAPRRSTLVYKGLNNSVQVTDSDSRGKFSISLTTMVYTLTINFPELVADSQSIQLFVVVDLKIMCQLVFAVVQKDSTK